MKPKCHASRHALGMLAAWAVDGARGFQGPNSGAFEGAVFGIEQIPASRAMAAH